MKNTASVNATGFPTRRTAILASLAGLGAAVSLPKVARAADNTNPLIADLAAAYDVAHARSKRADALIDQAEKRFVRPPVPEALFERQDDPLTRSFRSETYYDDRRWFGSSERIAMLRSWNTESLTSSKWWAPILVRRAEVLSAHEEWSAAKEAAEHAAGMPAVNEEYQAAWVIEKALRFRIIELRSNDPAAMRLKLRVFVDCCAYADWREGMDAAVARGIEAEYGPWEDAMGASILRDLVTAQMGDAA